MQTVTETSCYHCGLPVADPTRWTVLIRDKIEPMCCPGCQAVAGAIVAGGLEKYYQFRSQLATKADDLPSQDASRFHAYDDPVVQQSFVRTVDGLAETWILIEGIHCAACCWLIEQALAKLSGVSVSVNLGTHKALLRWNQQQLTLSSLLQIISAVGYEAIPYQANTAQQFLDREYRTQLVRLGIAGIAMMQAMMFALALYSADFSGLDAGLDHEHKQLMLWFSLMVTLPVVFYSALPFYKGAWRNLKSVQIGMDVPISLALIIAFVASLVAVFSNQGDVYFDSISMFVFLLLLARFAESRARRFLLGSHLASVLPETCQCLPEPHNPARIETVAVTRVLPGDVIRVVAGDTIPLDGIIIDGHSSVNEATFSGEQQAIKKNTGDEVYAATVNGDGVLTLRVTQAAGNTRLDMITRLSESSEMQKPRVSVMIDKLASSFTLFVLCLAVAAGIYWYGHDSSQALAVVLSVLVVSCPCALSLATPAALAFCYQSLRRQGILITSSNMIEQLRGIDRVIFDKTGTLTDGNFSISDVALLSAVEKPQILEVAAALEKYSEHPLATAFRDIATDRVLTQVNVFSGKGIEGVYNAARYRIGSYDFCVELAGKSLAPTFIKQDGFSPIIYLATEQNWLAAFLLQDSLRPRAKEVIQQLQQWGKQVEILSGDSSGVAEALAKQLGVTHCRSHASPEQKLEHITRLQGEGHRVLMIGDGINDVPVLARANVSIAMNSASDFAKIKADAVLLSNALDGVLLLFRHCHKARRIMIQNILWALLYNGIALPLAAMGLVAPWLAAAGMSLSSLWVTFNSMRLRKLSFG